MDLDKRIIEGKRPLNCFDSEQAWQFMGKQCYFSDNAADFMDLDKADGDSMFYIAELQNIWTAEEYCFADNSNDWRFILPVDWVEQPTTPEFVPYTLDTWEQEFKPGDVIIFRGKVGTDREDSKYKCIYAGWRQFWSNDVVILGLWGFSFKELSELYEIYRNGTWEPFGRKVETYLKNKEC